MVHKVIFILANIHSYDDGEYQVESRFTINFVLRSIAGDVAPENKYESKKKKQL